MTENINRVWNKAISVPNKDPNVMRQDACGTHMKRDDYGNRNSEHG
jgi:hypothetical protein